MKSIITFFIFIFLYCNSTIPWNQKNTNVKDTPEEVFFREHLTNLNGKAICPITNASAIGRYLLWPSREDNRFSELDILLQEENIRIPKIFTPEHGLTGLEKSTGNTFKRNHRIVTLYNTDKSVPEKYIAHFNECDVLIYNLPDAGVRPYTYRSVMTLALKISAIANKKFILLDTPNMAAYLNIRGPVTEDIFFSVLGEQNIPFFPKYTYAELALHFLKTNNISVNLQIIKMKSYNERKHFLLQNFPYLPPSPNLPHYRSLECYWFSIFLEGINMDEGRSGKDPFCTIGHPDFLPGDMPPKMGGVEFEPFNYPALLGPFSGKFLHGFRLEIKDPEKYFPDKAAYLFIEYLLQKYPQKKWFRKGSSGVYNLDKITGNSSMRNSLENGLSYEEWAASEEHKRNLFKKQMQCCKLY